MFSKIFKLHVWPTRMLNKQKLHFFHSSAEIVSVITVIIFDVLFYRQYFLIVIKIESNGKLKLNQVIVQR